MSKEKLNGAIGGAFWLTVSTLIVKLLGVIYKIPLTRFLGEEGMGYFNAAYTVYGFFYLLCTAGVPKAVMMLISESSDDKEAEAKTMRCALYSFLILGISVTALFVILASPLSRLIGNSSAYATMIAVAPSVLFISIAGVVRGYLTAKLAFAQIAASQIIEGVAKLALGLIFAAAATRMSYSLPMISAFTILGVTLGAFFGLLYLVISAKIALWYKNTRQKYKFIENTIVIKRILRISVPITVSAAAMSLCGMIDLGMITRRLESLGYTESAAVALYGNYTTLSVPMFNLAIALITPISIAFLPLMTQSWMKKDRARFGKTVTSALELSAAIGAPIMIGMLVYSKEIIALLFGNVGVETGAFLLRLLTPAIFFSATLLVTNSALEASGNVTAPVISMLSGCALKICTGYFLIGNGDYGISGAPIGTVLCYVSATVISLVMLKIKCNTYAPVLRINILPHVCALVAVLASRVLYNFIITAISPSVALILSILTAALIYLGTATFFGVISKEKLTLMSKYTNLA